MHDWNLAYSVVQFNPRPGRFEAVNVGVLVFDKRNGAVVSKLNPDFRRARKLLGATIPPFWKIALEDYANFVEHEFSQRMLDFSPENFNSKRASIYNITSIIPTFGENAAEAAQRLFSELVDEKETERKKTIPVSTRLKNAFEDAGVLGLLEEKPDPVPIEKLGVKIKADYGYRNGAYNLIDSARLDEPEHGLEQAGKRILKGRALVAETPEHRLLVVADFGDQPATFVDSIKRDFSEAKLELFELGKLDRLAEDIRQAANH